MSVVESSDYYNYKDTEILQCIFSNSLKISACCQVPVISLTSIFQRSEFTEVSTAVSVPSRFLTQCRHEAEY